jgi:hypothetical protein
MGKNLFIRMAFTLAKLGGIDKSGCGKSGRCCFSDLRSFLAACSAFAQGSR